MGKIDNRWSWTSAIVGAAATAAVAALVTAKPKDPSFRLVSIGLTSINPRLPVLDPQLIFTVHVSNPNLFAAVYSSTTMPIIYDGAQLGSAEFRAGSHPARSCQHFRLRARLDGLVIAQHAGRLLGDVVRGEMVVDGRMEIEGQQVSVAYSSPMRNETKMSNYLPRARKKSPSQVVNVLSETQWQPDLLSGRSLVGSQVVGKYWARRKKLLRISISRKWSRRNWTSLPARAPMLQLRLLVAPEVQ